VAEPREAKASEFQDLRRTIPIQCICPVNDHQKHQTDCIAQHVTLAAFDLLTHCPCRGFEHALLGAVKAYGNSTIRLAIADNGAVAVIPSASNARVPIPHDPHIYAMRNLVDHFFAG
jgi:hypothetical protein